MTAPHVYFDTSEHFGVLFVCPCGWRFLADDTDAAETAAWQHVQEVGGTGPGGDHQALARNLNRRQHRQSRQHHRQKAGTHS